MCWMDELIGRVLESSPDPLGVRESTSFVVKNLKHVSIDIDKVSEVAEVVKKQIDKKQILDEEQFGCKKPTAQLIFLLDLINFCFWSLEGKEKWTVEYPKGKLHTGGWYSLVYSVVRAQDEGVPILHAGFWERLALEEAKHIFRGEKGTVIPHLAKRVEILNDAGKTLRERYDGQVANMLSKTKNDYGEIAKQIVRAFPSFEDFRIYQERRINFYKRAQIFAYDLGFLPEFELKNLSVLTAFADYKVPQMLRAMGILFYEKTLADRVDRYQLLDEGSTEEIEIRAATIWASELVAQQAEVEPVMVDNVLWKMSQDYKSDKPYHRTVTTSY